MSKYTTTIRRVPCWHGVTGFQSELSRSSRNGKDIIEGPIWERRWRAEIDAERMLANADAYFEAHDTAGAA